MLLAVRRSPHGAERPYCIDHRGATLMPSLIRCSQLEGCWIRLHVCSLEFSAPVGIKSSETLRVRCPLCFAEVLGSCDGRSEGNVFAKTGRWRGITLDRCRIRLEVRGLDFFAPVASKSAEILRVRFPLCPAEVFWSIDGRPEGNVFAKIRLWIGITRRPFASL